jgi:hypothetical protein
VHWFVIDTSNLNNPTLVSQGNIDYGSNYDTYYGNLTVDSAGNMIIGYSYSGPSVYASSAYAEISPGGTSLQDGGYYLTQGAASYNQLDDAGRNRWGDYSGVAIDPTDNNSFWLFNQYAASANSWGTTIGGVVVPAAGQAAVWEMNGTNVVGGGTVSPNPGPSWNAVGMGGFFGAGSSGILWQNASGQPAIWDMNGASVIGGGTPSFNPGPSWRAVGTGDFNGDGFSDILWQNADGQAAIWEMNGTNVVGGGNVGPDPGSGWKAVGTGDFNGDGCSDILWQNVDGEVAIWELDGTTQIPGGSQILPINPGPSWQVIGTGDFNADGHSDILFQNAFSGQVAIWEMNGTSVIGGGVVSVVPGPSWRAVGTGDFNGAGDSGILFQNTASGQVAIWDMNGANIIDGGVVSVNPGPGWRAVGTGGGSNILFQNTSSHTPV